MVDKKKYIVFFGNRCGYTIIPLTPEEPQNYSSVLQLSNKEYQERAPEKMREVLILVEKDDLSDILSVPQHSLLTIKGYISNTMLSFLRIRVTRFVGLTPFPRTFVTYRYNLSVVSFPKSPYIIM